MSHQTIEITRSKDGTVRSIVINGVMVPLDYIIELTTPEGIRTTTVRVLEYP